MSQSASAPLGRSLPLPPPFIAPHVESARGGRDDDSDYDSDFDFYGDDRAAAICTTPRHPHAVRRLTRRILSGTMLARHWITWGCVSLGLWAIGTAIAIIVNGGAPVVLALGFGGLAGGFAAGAFWYRKRYLEASTVAREGQLVTGIATYRRSRDTLGGEFGETLGALLGDTCHSVVFSIGFIRHEVRVAGGSDASDEGEACSVLVRPGARHALVFDRYGRAHVGELLRIA